MSFFQKFSNAEDAVKNIVRPELFFLDEDVSKEPLIQFDSYMKEARKSISFERMGTDTDYL